jgi:hypothetical protein
VTPNPRIVIVAMIACILAGCSDVSVPSIDSLSSPVTPQPAAAHHVVFAELSLESNIRIEPSNVEHEASGILDVQLNFRSISDADQYLVAFITFTQDGQFVEKQGPKRVVLHGNLHDTVVFSSMQPADDYMVTFDFAK